MNLDLVQVRLALTAAAPAQPLGPEVGHTPARAPSPLSHAAPQVEVSDDARLLRSVLDALLSLKHLDAEGLQQRGGAPIARPLATLALLTAGAPQALAANVRQALEECGAFYESHQSRWVQGQFDLAALRREPQARLLTTPHTSAAAPAERVENAGLHAAGRGPVAADAVRAAADVTANVQVMRNTDAVGADPIDALAKRDSAAAPTLAIAVPAPLTPVLEQQLHFLACGELSWRGEAWPGQALQLRLAQDRAPSSDDEDQPRAFQMTLRMELPRLGEVEAQLRVLKDDVGLRISGERPVLAELSGALPKLTQGFQCAGINLQSVAVSAHE